MHIILRHQHCYQGQTMWLMLAVVRHAAHVLLDCSGLNPPCHYLVYVPALVFSLYTKSWQNILHWDCSTYGTSAGHLGGGKTHHLAKSFAGKYHKSPSAYLVPSPANDSRFIASCP